MQMDCPIYLMGHSLVVGSNERSADLNEILDFSVLINGGLARSTGFSLESSESIGIDIHEPLKGDLVALSDSLLFFLHPGVEVRSHLVLDGVLAAGSDSLVFDLSLYAPDQPLLLVVHLVDEELEGMLVVVCQLDLSVGLVREPSFLG